MNSFAELKKLILSAKGDASTIDWQQYGQVHVQQKNDLLLFNYMSTCLFKRPAEWNWFERVSRGLVMNTRGKIVARPFDKFWNYGEVFPSGYPVEITDKVDGSLAIVFYYNDRWNVCTRGSFESEQAQWAEKFLHENYDLRGSRTDITLLCEIIYPQNRIVVDYGNREDLVLLGIRENTGEGDYWFESVKHYANCYGFRTPPCYEVTDIDTLIDRALTLGPEREGWVVRYSDGERVKVKGSTYLKIHKWIGRITEKSVAEAMVAGEFDEMLASCPPSLVPDLERIARQIISDTDKVVCKVIWAFTKAPKKDRKEFALWVKENHPELSKYLFLKYDNKLTQNDIIKGETLS